MSQSGIAPYTGGYNGGYSTGTTTDSSSGDPALDAANYDGGQGTTTYYANGSAPPNITNFAQGAQAGAAVIQPGSNGSATPWDPNAGGDPFGYGFNDYGNPGSGGGYSPGQSYNAAVNTAAGQANNFNSMSAQAGANTVAPTINNPYAAQTQATLNGVNAGQGALVKSLQATAANGQDSAAYGQYQSGVKQALAAQTAQANSIGGVAGAGARRMTQGSNAQTLAGSQAGGQLVAQQAQQAAQGQLGTTLGQQGQLLNQGYSADQAQALLAAQMSQGQRNISNAGVLGYNSLSQNEQGAQLNALQGASNSLLASEGLGQQQQNVQNQQNATYMGAAANAGSGLAQAAGNIYQGSQTSPASGPTEAQLENPYATV